MQKAFYFSGSGLFSRILVFLLIISFTVPLPLAGNANDKKAEQDANIARVQSRLNSPERQAAIAKIKEQNAKLAKSEDSKSLENASQSSSEKASVASKGEKTKALVASDKSLTPVVSKDAPVIARSEATRQSMPSDSAQPKKVSAVLFNAATSAMGLPGLDARNDSYDPNADQGLGFHADGTPRQADGTTGNNSASAGYNGKRAAAYMNNGVNTGSYNGMGTNLELDPIAKFNMRYFYSAKGGRSLNAQNGESSRELDPAQVMIDRSLNYGVGMVNSATEGLFLGLMESPYGGSRARLNFMVDWDGKINGEGDVLLPWYDSKNTTIYSQFGARTMNAEDSKDRWIGNVGVGQRWYPQAQKDGIGEDAGNLMLGYNAFFDNDFTRSHQRGGLGVEGQYDWVHLASNYYAPLSNWKNSKDFDGDFIQERPAEGWDVRAKGYVPFYRNVAITGAYTQWKGDNVGMFGASKLESDPNVWSYGVEYTPVPLVSGFVNQRSTERGSSDTEVGMRFTYNFNMPWEDQISHNKVAEMRTVGGSRHEFVDRENKIILEYKAKNNFHVEYLGKVGTNQFKFGIRNGFDKYVAGQQVRVSVASGATVQVASVEPSSFFAKTLDYLDKLFSVSVAYAAETSVICVSNAQGEFIIELTNVTQTPVVLNIQAGNSSQSVTLTDVMVTVFTYTLEASPASLMQDAPTSVTFTVKRNGSAVPVNTAVTFTANSNFTNLPSVVQSTNASGQITVSNLTAMASGTQTISATVDGQNVSVPVTVTAGTAVPVASDMQVVTTNQPADNSSLNEVKVRFLQYTGGPAVADGTTINWSLPTSPAGVTLTANSSMIASGDGWASMTLKDGQIGNRNITVQASYNGVTRTIDVHFTAPVLTLSNITGASTTSVNGNQSITVDVKYADGTTSAASLSSTSITWKTRNDAVGTAPVTTTTSNTNGSGVASFTATSPSQMKMYVEASAGNSLNTTVQFGADLPNGFIVGPGGSNGQTFAGQTLSWDAAVAFCANQGGRLPDNTNYSVSGGVPLGAYWSRQGHGDGIAFLLDGDGDGLIANGTDRVKDDPRQVVCVQ